MTNEQKDSSDRTSLVAEKENKIFQMANEGKKDEAKTELFNLVVSCAKQGDFKNAERLRDRIYEIDPLALSEIIRSGDIIDQEKSNQISEDHNEIWSQLMKILTQEEYTAIYHEMVEHTYNPEEFIIDQGSKNDDLLFFNHGLAKVWYQQDDREVFIKDIHQGEIIGENFFYPSVWTVSISAKTTCKVSKLKLKNCIDLNNKMVGLEAKLRDFLNHFDDIPTRLEQGGLDRRRHSRFKLSLKIIVQTIDKSGQSTGRGLKGEMADISQSGLSFLIRINKKESCRMLLGRHLKIIIPLYNIEKKVSIIGTVVAVQPFNLMENDYSIHLKFDKLLSENTVKTLCQH